MRLYHYNFQNLRKWSLIKTQHYFLLTKLASCVFYNEEVYLTQIIESGLQPLPNWYLWICGLNMVTIILLKKLENIVQFCFISVTQTKRGLVNKMATVRGCCWGLTVPLRGLRRALGLCFASVCPNSFGRRVPLHLF